MITICLILVTLISYHAYQQVQKKRTVGTLTEQGEVINSAISKAIHIPYGAGRPEFTSVFFEPPRVNIHKGNEILWINDDLVSHSVTSSSFNSGMIWPKHSPYGSSDFRMVFKKSGTFAYFCQVHPYMSGVVYVDVPGSEMTSKSPAANSHNININMPQNSAYQVNYGPYFVPSYALTTSGSKITWLNKDYVPHTATSTDSSFDTGPILPGQSKSINIVHNSGTIAYYCEIHPWMQATIQVESKILHENQTHIL